MIKKIFIFFALIMIATSTAAFAIDFRPVAEGTKYDTAKWHDEPEYNNRAFGKFVYGAWNFMFGWMELFREPYEAAVLGDNVFVGAAKGITYSVADMAGGALSVITFPVTCLQIPLPEGGIKSREF